MMDRRDLILGALFFLAMAAFGAFILWVNRAKWGVEVEREEQRHRVFQADQRREAGLTRLARARTMEGENRRRTAREAMEYLSYAIDVSSGIAELYAARAEAYALAGEPEKAREDLARARALEPQKDWHEVEARCATTP